MGPKSEYISLHQQEVLNGKEMVLMILMAVGSLFGMMCFLYCIRKYCSSPPDSSLSINKSKKLKFVNMNEQEKEKFISSLQSEDDDGSDT